MEAAEVPVAAAIRLCWGDVLKGMPLACHTRTPAGRCWMGPTPASSPVRRLATWRGCGISLKRRDMHSCLLILACFSILSLQCFLGQHCGTATSPACQPVSCCSCRRCCCRHHPIGQQDPEHDPDVFNATGAAPLHLAAAGGHMGVVAFLLQRGSFVDMQDWQVGGLGGGWGVVQLGGGLVMGRRRV